MTVGELVRALQQLPQDLTVVYSDAQHGDCPVREVAESTCYCGTSARIVKIS